MSSAASQPPSAKKKFGGFEILEKVGEGGMGAVYRAQQLSLNRIVALKILPPQLTSDASFVDMFRKESLAAAMLHHPNLIAVFDAGEADGLHYYAMEFVEGETLQQLLTRVGSLSEPTALQIALCVANALKFGWDKAQLIHRDVKPANIMIGHDGNVKLCDLGLAKRFGENTMLSLSGISYGTPHYVSPEQARGQSCIDQRSDIYSLGMTLYHALTGQVPFPAATAAAVMAKHLTEQLPDPREYSPTLTPAVCRLLERMLAKDPAERYQNWDSVLADLNCVIQGQLPQTALLAPGKSSLHRNPKFESRVAAPRPMPVAAPGSRRRANYATLVTVVTSLVLIALIAGIIHQRQKNPPAVNPSSPPKAPENPAKTAAELLKQAELLQAANPDKTDAVIAAYRKIIAEHAHTPAAEAARDHLARIAQKQFDAAAQYAENNPDDFDGIIARFKRITSHFPESPLATSAQEQVNHWQNKRQFRAEAQRALARAVEFADANPTAFDQIIERLEKLAQEFEGSEPANSARTLAEDWRGKKQRFLQQQEARRAAEIQQREQQQRRLAEEQARERAALLRAEVAFVTFGRKFFTELQKRDYGAAVSLAQQAAEDEALAPLRGRLQACGDFAQRLRSFWTSLPSHLAPLKGQPIVLRGVAGTFDELTATGVSIERNVGDTVASIEVPRADITSAEWLALLNRALEKAPADELLSFALFCFAEGRLDVADLYFDRAKNSGANVEAQRAVIAALQRIPQEEAAMETIAELRQLVEKSDWTGARRRLEAINSKFSASLVVQSSREELDWLGGRLTKAEREIAEAEAARLIAEFKRLVGIKYWLGASDVYARLADRYAHTDAMAKVAAELAPLKQTVDIMTGQVPSPDEDKDKREFVKRRGGKILIVNADAQANEAGPGGEPVFADLAAALGKARANDGIEVWDGIYKAGSFDKPLNQILIYGKAGAMPVIHLDEPPGKPQKLFTVGEGLQLENLCLVGDTARGDGRALFFRGQDNKSCSLRLRQCVIVGGGPFLLEGASRSALEIEDCVLVNFQRLIQFGNVATLRLQNSALVNFSRLFNAHENSEIVLNLSLNECVFASGILCEELPMRNGPWDRGWQGRRWRWRDWMRERESQSVLRNKVTYRGDRNVIVNSNSGMFKVPGDELASLNDWRQIFFGQDSFSLDIEMRNPLEIFVNAAKGDFRIRPDTRAARIGADGQSPGPRWQPWRWKAFQDAVAKYNLQLPEP